MRIEKIKSPFDNLMLEVAVSETKTQPKAIVQFSSIKNDILNL